MPIAGLLMKNQAMGRIKAALLSLTMMVRSMTSTAQMSQTPVPIVIGHRGASGYVPEHTLTSYFIAIQDGADYVEPDLVMTKDAVLVARHENEIGGTTNVAEHPEFAQRRRTQIIDGERMSGWFTEDFTLAEIKTLRARERLPMLRPLNRAFDGLLEVPTFDEIMQLARDANLRRGGKFKIGVYPETKHPAHFAAIGLAQEAAVLETLARFDYATGPVFIQSFDPRNLQQLRGMTRLPLVQLLEYEVGDIAHIGQYADAIGIAKDLATEATVARAHAQGLLVHVWTSRAENEFLPDDLKSSGGAAAHGDLKAEIERYLARGIDGFFTDFPAI